MAQNLPPTLRDLVYVIGHKKDPMVRAKQATQLLEHLQEAIAAVKVLRQKSIKALGKSGMTYEEIGAQLGITKGRVYQILNGQSGTTGKYYESN